MTNRWTTSLLIILGAILIVALAVPLMAGGGDHELSLTPGAPKIAAADQLSEVAEKAHAPLLLARWAQ